MAINSQKDLKILSKNKSEIITKAKYGPSKPTKISLTLDEDIAFLSATIIGDGHLRKEKFQISIELTNKRLMKEIRKTCKRLFNRRFNIKKRKKREGIKQSYAMAMDSKAIFMLLNKVFEIPIGKKSHKVKIPKEIFNSNDSIKSAFLIGIFLTEGGRRKRGYGLSTASPSLWKDLIRLFSDLKIKLHKDKWMYKKYKKMYYGISFKKDTLTALTRGCRSGQTGQILETCFQGGYA